MGFPAWLLMTLMTTSSISCCRVVVYVPRVNTHAHTQHNTPFPSQALSPIYAGVQQSYCMAQRHKKRKDKSRCLFLEKPHQIDSGIYSPKSCTLSLHHKTFLIHYIVSLLREDKIKY